MSPTPQENKNPSQTLTSLYSFILVLILTDKESGFVTDLIQANKNIFYPEPKHENSQWQHTN